MEIHKIENQKNLNKEVSDITRLSMEVIGYARFQYFWNNNSFIRRVRIAFEQHSRFRALCNVFRAIKSRFPRRSKGARTPMLIDMCNSIYRVKCLVQLNNVLLFVGHTQSYVHLFPVWRVLIMKDSANMSSGSRNFA